MPDIIINNTKIEYVNEVKNLGYQLNRTNTSDNHIIAIRKKVFGALNSVRPLKNILPSNVKLILVKSLILPLFDYMDIIYHNYGVHGTRGDSDKLEQMLNICVRFVLNIKRYEHITPHREELCLLKLYDRRTLHVACMIHKILNDEAPPYLKNILIINAGNTRSKNKLIVQKPINNNHKTSLFIGGPSLWNSLPNN